MTTDIYHCANRYNVQTGQWEYQPRYAMRVDGRMVIEDAKDKEDVKEQSDND